MIRSLFLGLAALIALASQAEGGRNAGGALIVHTNDSVVYTATGSYCGVDFDDPGSCENANTRTDKDENTPAVIWFLAAFPTGSDPAVTGIQFGVDFNMPAGQGYVGASGPCGPNPQLLPTQGFPDTPGGALLGYGEAVADTLFPFFWFAVYGIDKDSYFGTAVYPSGEALFADDDIPAVEDPVEGFGIVRWYSEGSNDCPTSGGQDESVPDGGGESFDGEEGEDGPGGEDSWPDVASSLAYLRLDVTSDSMCFALARSLEYDYDLRVAAAFGPDGVICCRSQDSIGQAPCLEVLSVRSRADLLLPCDRLSLLERDRRSSPVAPWP